MKIIMKSKKLKIMKNWKLKSKILENDFDKEDNIDNDVTDICLNFFYLQKFLKDIDKEDNVDKNVNAICLNFHNFEK